MCGIYGILGRSESGLEKAVLDRMGRVTHHRGPDGEGTFSDSDILMGMRRLAIIDVEGGQQPIFSEDRQIVVVCNGEIYNFRELRKELQAKGHTFSTGSDTEVIVHLYEEIGGRCIDRLNGMFACAIWDRSKKRLLLARDRLGIKPLYLARKGKATIFASELKAILQVPGVSAKICEPALREYLALGYVPAPLSMIDGVDKLQPGTCLVVDADGARTQRFWSVPEAIESAKDDRDWISQISATMEKSVVSQMVSDVPLGAFLSGGVDSSAVVAFMARNSSKPVKTYSIGFDADTGGSYYNELGYAREVSNLFGTDHHEIVVRPDVATLLPALLWHMDEPIADAAFITTYLVSQFAKSDVTVILSGVGGDELFGGYRRYWSEYLAQIYRKVPRMIRLKVLQPVSRGLPSDRHSVIFDWFRLAKGFMAGAELDADERYEEFIRVFDHNDLAQILGSEIGHLSEALSNAFADSSNADPLRRLIEVDLRTQLPDDLLMLTDRMSMATSLECRVPLLDDALIDLAMAMPSHLKVCRTRLKVGMKEALRGILPDGIIDRKKRGFGAPIGGWFKHELSSFLDAVLSEKRVRDRGVFDWDHVQRLVARHKLNKGDYTDHILALVNFEIWCQLYIDGDSISAIGERLGSEVAG